LSEAEAIEAIRAATDKGEFIGAVLISRDGVPVFQAAYGYADLERKTPNEVETKFRVGSMNKMFTAVAVLQLVQRSDSLTRLENISETIRTETLLRRSRLIIYSVIPEAQETYWAPNSISIGQPGADTLQ
jgi:hypothetical protein